MPRMRVVLATVGTRGDVQPFVALAQALRKRGHSALVACPATFADLVTRHGVEHAALGEDMHALMVAGGSNIQTSIAGMQKYFTEELVAQAPRLVELAKGADAIVSTAMAWSGASAAEKIGISALSIFPSTAALRSGAHPPPLFPFFGLPRFLYGLLWSMTDSMIASLADASVQPSGRPSTWVLLCMVVMAFSLDVGATGSGGNPGERLKPPVRHRAGQSAAFGESNKNQMTFSVLARLTACLSTQRAKLRLFQLSK